ncbi:unnamed protein product, partial [Hapterophycus canaliculatus]
APASTCRHAPLPSPAALLTRPAHAPLARANRRTPQSNHSKVDAAMREVERRARTAGGRVWALIRGNSRQHAADDDDNDIDDDDDTGSDSGVPGGAEGGGGGGGLFSPGRTGNGRAADNGHNDAAAPEWVLSRLELMRMRRRGSFLNGDELGPVRTTKSGATSSAAAAAAGAANGGGGAAGGEVVTAESFGNLATLASAEGNEERRDTDEAVSGLRDAMERHSAALSRLAGWMLQAAMSPGIDESVSSSRSSSGRDFDAPMARPGAAVAAAAMGGGEMQGGGGGLSSPPPLPPTPLLDSTRGVSESSSSEAGRGVEEEEGVRAMLELSRESDVLEGRVKRERFRAHSAADEEIHCTPELYREACALGNALILKGHDYLSQ